MDSSYERGPSPKLDQKFLGMVVKTKDGREVPNDQWVVFLAKDNAVPGMLNAYYHECAALGAKEPQLEGVRNLITRVNAWREAHPELCKVPDVDPGELLP